MFIGHSEAVAIEFENPISADEAREILREARRGCLVANFAMVERSQSGARGSDNARVLLYPDNRHGSHIAYL